MGVNIKVKSKQPKPSEDETLDKLGKAAEIIHPGMLQAGASMTLPDGEESKAIVGTVNIKHKDGAEEQKTSVLGFAKGKGPLANVGMRCGATINTGQYQNIKVELSLFVPSECIEAEIDAALNFVKGWIDTNMTELLDEYTPKKE